MASTVSTVVPIVTPEQAEMFADEWCEESYNTGVVLDACRLAAVTEGLDPEQRARVEKAICMRVFELARTAITDAFVTATTEALRR